MSERMRDAIRYWGERHNWNMTAIMAEIQMIHESRSTQTASVQGEPKVPEKARIAALTEDNTRLRSQLRKDDDQMGDLAIRKGIGK